MMKRLFILMTLLAAAANALAATGAGNVVRVRGDVEVTGPNRSLEARVGLVLNEADRVLTRERSRAKMLFRDDSILTLGENSVLSVRQYLYSPENKRADSIYELLDGRLRAVVGRGSFRVETPTAYAAARGTIFIIWYDPETRVTGVAVVEGEVEVGGITADTDNLLTLTEGQMTLVPAGSPPQPAEGFNPNKIMKMTGLGDWSREYRPMRQPGPAAAREQPLASLDLVRLTLLPPFIQPPAAADQATAVGMTLNFP